MDLPRPEFGFSLIWHWWGTPFMGIWHCLTWPCIHPTASSAFLSLGTLSFPWGTVTCWGFADEGDSRLELILTYFYFYFILLEHTQVESITPILNLRHMVLERTSQNGEFTVMHSQISSLSMKYMCLLSYFKVFSFSFESLVPITWFSACCTFVFFPSCLSCSLISAKIFNCFFLSFAFCL